MLVIAEYATHAIYSTISRATVFSVAWLMGTIGGIGLAKKLEQRQRESIRLLKATHKFNRKILLSPPSSLHTAKHLTECYSYSDWIEDRSIQVLSTPDKKQTAHANFQHITTNKAPPATITKTVISSH